MILRPGVRPRAARPVGCCAYFPESRSILTPVCPESDVQSFPLLLPQCPHSTHGAQHTDSEFDQIKLEFWCQWSLLALYRGGCNAVSVYSCIGREVSLS